jgi:hypothetical protein
VSVFETVLIYVLIPLAAYGLIALLASGFKSNAGPRYRPGSEWNYPPVWWTANPAALPAAHAANEAPAREDVPAVDRPTRGGARGRW